jgi:hypothetical protein
MSTCAPALHSGDTRAPYADGAAGHEQSLQLIARKIREGRVSRAVLGWAGNALHGAGLDGRGMGPIIRKQTQAILDAYRNQTVYTPDPIGSELIQSAEATLCLAKDLCVRRADCFPEGNLLLRDDYELIPIEEIRIGDNIWGFDKWTRVDGKVFKGPLSVDAVQMNNGSTMYLTPDHKVYVGKCAHNRGPECSTCNLGKHRDHFERVTISDLQESDALLQPSRIDLGVGTPDPDRAYVEGLAIADGWTSFGGRPSLSAFFIAGKDGHRKESQKLEVKAICERLGVATRMHRRYIAIKDSEWALRVHRFGSRARFKRVETLNLGEAAAAATIRGLMADSTANTHGTGRTYSTTSHHLMVQVRVLHRMFGVSTGVKMLTPEQHGGAGKHPMWRLQIRSKGSRAEKMLGVLDIERKVARLSCWDITTSDHYVYLPEHDVTVSNCDDGVVAVGSALLGIGIPTMVVKEDYPSQNGKTPQSHVLLYSRDESGDWFSIDPSTRSAVGVVNAPRNTTRTWVNPMEDAPVEIVGIGRHFSETIEIVGIGAPPTIPGTWTNIADNSVKAGLRYAVGVVVNPNWTLDDVTKFFNNDWLIEQLGQRTEFPTINAWIMIGLSRKTQTLNDTPDAHYSAVLQEAAPPVEPAPATNPLATKLPPVPAPSVGIGDVLMWSVGIAAVGGLGYGAYEWNKKHKKRLRR